MRLRCGMREREETRIHKRETRQTWQERAWTLPAWSSSLQQGATSSSPSHVARHVSWRAHRGSSS